MSFLKKFFYIFIFCGFFLAGLGLVLSKQAKADTVNGFFQKDAALTTFGDEVKLKQQGQIELSKDKKQKEKEAVKKEEPVSGKSEEPNNNPELKDSNEIVAKFGDPDINTPVLGQPNAPKSFQGLIAALNAGDKKLAFKYARQYVKYTKDLDRTAKEAMAIQALAMEKEGLLPKDGWAADKFKEERLELQDELANENTADLPSQHRNLGNLNPKVKAFLSEAAKAEGIKETLPNGEEIEEETTSAAKVKFKPSGDELKYRNQAKAMIAGKAPQDPKGEIDIYFFLRTTDDKSIQMGNVFEKLYNKYKDNEKVRIVGLTLDNDDESSVDAYRARNSARFPIANGEIFSKQLGVQKAPTIMMVARNTGQAVQEQGIKNFYFLDELVGYIMGER